MTGAFGYPSVIYKVLSHDDGNIYALRRFDSVRTNPKIVATALDNWRRIQHPNIVRLSKAFLQHGMSLHPPTHPPTHLPIHSFIHSF